MYSWNLPLEKLDALTLAADVRLGKVDYCNDQIWELKLLRGDPASLALYTTFGLRARCFYIFPQFVDGTTSISDPALFERPPILHWAYPNFAHLSYAPFKEIEVISDYWLADSKSIAGRLRITNQSSIPRQIRLEWAALLTPDEEGSRMAGTKMHGVWVLSGKTEGLSPVIFMSGGVEAGNIPYPALYLAAMLRPGETHDFTWAEAALGEAEASFELARQTASRNWEAERTRVEMINASQIEVETGEPEWNTAFTLTQQIAMSLLVSAKCADNPDGSNDQPSDTSTSNDQPAPSLVLTRKPDQGFSRRGDGSDYSHLWAGQTPLDAYYFANLVMPGAAQQVKGLLRNFLAIQKQESGFIDWKAGQAGQCSNLLATPILAGLTWKYYQATNDKAFLEETFAGLLNFFQIWFTPQHDRDGDGCPEWEDACQFGFDSHPVFDRWQSWSQGADITTAESPALNAFLHQEASSLIQIAEALGYTSVTASLKELAQRLGAATNATWEPADGRYHYRDRDTHLGSAGELISQTQGNAELKLNQRFAHPVRLVLQAHTSGGGILRSQISVEGKDASGKQISENIPAYRWQSGLHTARVTSELAYSLLECMQIQGIDDEMQITIVQANYQQDDLSLLLPLWAGLPTAEQAQTLLVQAVKNPQRFGLPYGLPLWPKTGETTEQENLEPKISMVLNLLVGEGLLKYNYRAEAAELVTRLMAAICQALRHQKTFFEHYLAESGRGVGECNALGGLAPVGLFLETLGVSLVSPWQVRLVGKNPFPWPVTIRYRGLKIQRDAEQTVITFPDEQTAIITDPAPCVVALENKHG